MQSTLFLRCRVMMLAGSCLLAGTVASARTWTGSNGRNIEAEYVRVEEGGKVVLKMNGKEISVALTKFSEADRAWVRARQETGGADGVVRSPGATTTPLTRAIRLEEFDEAAKQMGLKWINKPDGGLYHPLTYGVYTRNVPLVRALLKAGAEPNTVEFNGKTALFVAANLGDVELVSLLCDHNVALSPKTTSRSPLAAAIRSGSLPCMNVLLEKFPKADPGSEWDDAGRPGRARRLGSALNYCTAMGYDELAHLLLKKNKSRRFVGEIDIEALRSVARRDDVDMKLVTGLLDAGISPVGGDLQAHLHPSNALDEAAARGHSACVSEMLRKLDRAAGRSWARRAGFIAAAHSQPEVAESLFRWAGSGWPDLDAISNASEQEIAGLTGVQEDHSKLQSPGPLIPPRVRYDKGMLRANGSVAIISDPALRNLSDMLSGKLSEVDGLMVVDRESLKPVLVEESLKHFQSRRAESFHKTLDLIPAEHLIILSSSGAKGQDLVRISLINVRSGMVTASLGSLRKAGEKEAEGLAALISVMTRKLQENLTSAKRGVAVSCVTITPEIPTGATLGLASQCDALLPHLISRSPGCLRLSRDQFRHLEFEKTLGQEGGYWEAAWIVDGSVGDNASKEPVLTLRANSIAEDRALIATRPIKAGDSSEAVTECWAELAGKMKLQSGTAASTPRAVNTEGDHLAQQASWFLNAGYPRESLELATAALTLSERDSKVDLVAVDACLALIPIEPCSHVANHPPALDPDVKFGLVRHLETYESLARFTLSYLEKRAIEGPDNNATPGGDRFQYASVLQAFHELGLAVRLFDDSIIKRRHGARIRTLKARLNLINALYFERLLSTASFSHLLHLMRDENGYLAVYQPEMIEKTYKLLQARKADKSNKSFTQQLSRQVFKALTLPRPSAPLKHLVNSLQGFRDTDDTFYILGSRCMLASDRDEKLEAMESLLTELSSARNGRGSGTPSNTAGVDVQDLFGVDAVPFTTKQYIRNPGANPLPPGGFGSVLWEFPAKLRGTAEHRRMLGLYRWFDQIRDRPDSQMKDSLFEYAKAARSLVRENHIQPEDWSILHRFAQDNGLWSGSRREIADLGGFQKPDTKSPKTREVEVFFVDFPESSSSKATNLHLGAASIADGKLWVPSSDHRKGPPDYQRAPSIHVMHVIDLKTKKVKAIQLPRMKSHLFNGRDKIMFGDEFAYYLLNRNSWNSDAQIFVIHRKTHEVTEVELPLPYVVSYTPSVRNDTLYLSLTDKRNAETRREPNYLNMVVGIHGTKLTGSLVSNRRKPKVSPLDSPECFIERLEWVGDDLYLLSNLKWARQKPNLSKVFRYTPGADPLWTETNRFEHKRVSQKTPSLGKDPNRWIHNVGDTAYQLVCTDHVAELVIRDPKRYSPLGKFKLSLGPVDHGSFNKASYHVPRPKERGKTIEYDLLSANDLFGEQRGTLRLIDQWGEGYLISAYQGGYGVPAIWYLPNEKLQEEIETALGVDRN